jgi:hypothetical protein
MPRVQPGHGRAYDCVQADHDALVLQRNALNLFNDGMINARALQQGDLFCQRMSHDRLLVMRTDIDINAYHFFRC